MWKRLLHALKSAAGSRPPAPRAPAFVYRVRTPDGARDLVSLFSGGNDVGLVAEAIVGEGTHLLEEGEGLTEANFRPNPVFVRLLHHVVAHYAPQLPEVRAAARRQQSGWVYVIDARTKTPEGHVPLQDIIGSFEVRNGEITAYTPSPKHLLMTADGLFQLDPLLHDRLMEHINERAAAKLPS